MPPPEFKRWRHPSPRIAPYYSLLFKGSTQFDGCE